MPGPLSNIRVLDLSRILAGPWATQLLADLGADVVKVERPGTGDDTRAWGPPFLKNTCGEETRESAYFLAANRGKQSITLDISTPEGQRIARELAAQSDVVVENYKVGDMARYGLDYPTLCRLNPQLVYCSITGFGQSGPYRDRAGYDFLIQGMGGLMSVTGERDDAPGGGPQKCGVPVSDMMTGMYAAVAILAALWERNASGKGQYIDMALLDTQVGWLANHAMNYLVSGELPRRWGNAHPNLTPYQTFPSADGHFVLAIGNDGQFARFCGAAGIPEVPKDLRFIDNRARLAHRAELTAAIEAVTPRRTTAQWISALEPLGVPCGPINTLKEVFDDPQVQARRLGITLPHPLADTVPAVANPIKLSRTPIEYRAAAPLLGQHTDEVLRERLGATPEDIDRLRTQRIV